MTDRRCVALSLLAGIKIFIAFLFVNFIFDLAGALTHVNCRGRVAVVGRLFDFDGEDLILQAPRHSLPL